MKKRELKKQRILYAYGQLDIIRIPMIESAAAKLDRHRNQKDFDLATSITDEKAQEYAVYLQGLRDLPENIDDPVPTNDTAWLDDWIAEIPWPEQPE